MILVLSLVKATLVISAAAAAVTLAGRRSSAAFRHLICTVAIGGLLVLPILSAALPAWALFGPATGGYYDLTGQAEVGHYDLSGPADHLRQGYGGQEAGHYDLSGPADHLREGYGGQEAGHYVLAEWVWAALYLAGVLLLIAALAVDRFKVRRIARRAAPLKDVAWQTLFRECSDALGVRRRVELLRSTDRATPMAIGIRRPAIVIPALADVWSNEMRRAVLLHELAHVARRDCLSQTVASFACALYWVHPGSWWLARRLRTERELACDDLVLSAGTDAHEYAGHLLELAYTLRGHATPALATGMAAPGQIESRLLALLDRARKRAAPSRLCHAAAIVLVLAVLIPIATATVAGQPSQSNASALQTASARAIQSERLRRWLSLDFWRQAAADGLSRLADQASYISEMRRLGYSVVDVDVLFKLRQRGVTPDFVRELAAEGLSGLSADDLLEAANHGIDPEYVRDLKGLGYWPLDMKTLVRMRSHGIDGEFIRDMRTFGYRWSLDELVQARSHGIDADYLLAISSLGYEHLALDELTLLRSHGVTPMRILSANGRTGTHLSVNDLTTLASHGWKP